MPWSVEEGSAVHPWRRGLEVEGASRQRQQGVRGGRRLDPRAAEPVRGSPGGADRPRGRVGRIGGGDGEGEGRPELESPPPLGLGIGNRGGRDARRLGCSLARARN